MSRPINRLLIDGQRLDVRAEQLLLPGSRVIRTMSGASSAVLLFDDPDGTLRRSGALTVPREKPLNNFTQAPWKDRLGKTVLDLDGNRFRLAGVSKQGTTLQLTFEDEIAALLRQYDKPIKSSRQDETRAQFVIRMLREVKERRIDYVVTDPGKHQPRASIDDTEKRRDRGVNEHSHLTVDGVTATAEQLKNINTVLDQAVKDEASNLATLALIEACIQESRFLNLTGGDSSSVGILQLLDIHLGGSTSTHGGRRDVALVTHLFLTQGFSGKGGAIQLAHDHGDWNPGKVAQAVQGSAFPGRYETHRTEAQAILDAYGGVDRTEVVVEEFFYQRGLDDGNGGVKKEDSWAATGRLANQVRWRRFAAENVFYFVTDKDLFKSKPRGKPIGSRSPGVIDLDYDVDYGKPVSKITITCRADLWVAPEGSVIQVDDNDPLIDGRWLVDTNTQLLQQADTTIELRRPAPAKPEPAPKTRTETFSSEDTSGVRGQILKIAEKAVRNASHYSYLQARPMPSSLTAFPKVPLLGHSHDANQPTTDGVLQIDCSAFVTLVYKAAGAPDPNGAKYNGSGNTSTLRAHGTRTSDPQPGDLVHWGSGAPGNASHVAIYTGREDGKDMCISMGVSLHPGKLPVASMGLELAGYWTYDLTDTGL